MKQVIIGDMNDMNDIKALIDELELGGIKLNELFKQIMVGDIDVGDIDVDGVGGVCGNTVAMMFEYGKFMGWTDVYIDDVCNEYEPLFATTFLSDPTQLDGWIEPKQFNEPELVRCILTDGSWGIQNSTDFTPVARASQRKVFLYGNEYDVIIAENDGFYNVWLGYWNDGLYE